MPDPVKFFRVTALPPVLVVDGIYFTESGDIYVVGDDGVARKFTEHFSASYFKNTPGQTVPSSTWVTFLYQAHVSKGVPTVTGVDVGASTFDSFIVNTTGMLECTVSFDLVSQTVNDPFANVVSEVELSLMGDATLIESIAINNDGWSPNWYINHTFAFLAVAGTTLRIQVRTSGSSGEILFGQLVIK